MMKLMVEFEFNDLFSFFPLEFELQTFLLVSALIGYNGFKEVFQDGDNGL